MGTDFLGLFLAFVMGAGVGIFYFGGLWVTVHWVLRSHHPAMVTLASFYGRTGLSVWGFYIVMNRSWVRLMVCLAGFLLVRTVMLRRLRPEQSDVMSLKEVQSRGNHS